MRPSVSATDLTVDAVLSDGSVGVRRYARRLADALAGLDVDYRLGPRPHDAPIAHFHIANSTRSVLPYAAACRRPFVVTVHDVLPRTRLLREAYRTLIMPLCVQRASRVVVHSVHAADLLERLGIDRSRVTIIAHPASPAPAVDRSTARRVLKLDGAGAPLFVLPGVLKPAKLIDEVVDAARPLLAEGRMRLLLAGRVGDPDLADRALAAGAQVVNAPDDARYALAVTAADAVISVRAESVGESNGPLLDALGAGRPALITGVGSAPEIAGVAGVVVAPNAVGIRDGLLRILDDDERRRRAQAAVARGLQLTWAACAVRHQQCFEDLAGRAGSEPSPARRTLRSLGARPAASGDPDA